MIIIEGIRRAGKTFTINTIKKYCPGMIFYKDTGLEYAKELELDIDDYVISRDLTYSQLIPSLPKFANSNLVFDRQYYSSYVYGQFYRNKYSKEFWQEHVERVENEYDEFLDNIIIMFLTLKNEDFRKIAEMDRQKDDLEDKDENSYLKQYELYNEVANISKARIYNLKAFQSEDYIKSEFEKVLKLSLKD
jgi:thymidylate kinase